MKSQTEFTELTSRSNLGFGTIEVIEVIYQISRSKSKQGFETIKKMKGGENG